MDSQRYYSSPRGPRRSPSPSIPSQWTQHLQQSDGSTTNKSRNDVFTPSEPQAPLPPPAPPPPPRAVDTHAQPLSTQSTLTQLPPPLVTAFHSDSEQDENWEEELLRQEENLARQSANRYKPKEDWTTIVLRWLRQVVLFMMVAVVAATPGTVCFFIDRERIITDEEIERRESSGVSAEGEERDAPPVPRTPECFLWNVNLVWWSLFFLCSMLSYLFAVILTQSLLLLFRKYQALARILLYYVTNLDFSLTFLMWSVFTQIAWSVILGPTPIMTRFEAVRESPWVLKPATQIPGSIPGFVQNAITCLLITSACWLVKDLTVRLIAIKFHRTSYAARIWQAMFTEFVLASLMNKEVKRPSRKALQIIVSATNIFGSVSGPPRSGKASLRGSSSEGEEADAVEASSSDEQYAHAGYGGAQRRKRAAGKRHPAFSPFPAPKHAVAPTQSLDPSSLPKGTSSAPTLATLRKKVEDDIISGRQNKIEMTDEEILGRHLSDYRLAQFIAFLTENSYYHVYACEMEAQQLGNKKRTAAGGGRGGGGWARGKELERTPTTQRPSKLRAQATRSLAQRLFSQIKSHDADNIVKDDFLLYIPEPYLDDAFRIFDSNRDGALNYREFISTIHSISKERKSLSETLSDAEKAIHKLDNAFLIFMFCVLSLVWALILFELDLSSMIVSVSSLLVALSFSLGATAKALVESVVFLFVSHPFDIGDRVLLGTDEVVHTVYRMNLMNTVFRRYDNAQVYLSNLELSKLAIVNLRRSPEMIDVITTTVLYQTPAALLRRFESRILSFIQRTSTHFQPHAEVYFKEAQDCNKLIIQVWVHHRHNFADMKRFRQRRSRVVLKMRELAEELGISYVSPPLPVAVRLRDGGEEEEEEEDDWEARAEADAAEERWERARRWRRKWNQVPGPGMGIRLGAGGARWPGSPEGWAGPPREPRDAAHGHSPAAASPSAPTVVAAAASSSSSDLHGPTPNRALRHRRMLDQQQRTSSSL